MRGALATLACAAFAAGCGGSLCVGSGCGHDGDRPPSVSVAASTGSARPGDTVRLVAAASDDFGIDEVRFFRLEFGGGSVDLGRVRQPPYVWDAVMPDTASAQVQFFAVAVDDVGQRTNSAPVTVQVLR